MLWTSQTKLGSLSEWERGITRKIRGWWANLCLQIGWWYGEAGQNDYLIAHSNIPLWLYECWEHWWSTVWNFQAIRDVMYNSVRSLYKGNLCHESGSTSFPKTVLSAYQPPPPCSQVNTRCEVWWNEPIGLSTDIVNCMCHKLKVLRWYVNLVNEDKKLPFCILERVSHCFGLESSDVCCM